MTSQRGGDDEGEGGEEKMEKRWVAIVVLPLDETPLRPRIREGGGGGEEEEAEGGMGGGVVM